MGRGIVRPIQSLNEKAVYNIGFSHVYFYFFSTLLLWLYSGFGVANYHRAYPAGESYKTNNNSATFWTRPSCLYLPLSYLWKVVVHERLPFLRNRIQYAEWHQYRLMSDDSSGKSDPDRVVHSIGLVPDQWDTHDSYGLRQRWAYFTNKSKRYHSPVRWIVSRH